MSESPTLFLLGATGYLGSQFLLQLAKSDLPKFHIRALLRASIEKKEAQLKDIYSNLSVVKRSLDDDAVIQEEASRADYVINCASADHHVGIISILAGLDKRTKLRPEQPPIFIHISGLGITSDNSRGEFVDLDKVPRYSDIGFSLDQCPSNNAYVASNKLIVEYGTRKKNPIRTLILFPSYIYGVGEGIQKTTMAMRILLDFFSKSGCAFTIGPGYNRMGSVHVRDCADAILVVFKAALEGRADEGKEGLYFVSSDQPMLYYKHIVEAIGNAMFSKGLYRVGGAQSLPMSIASPGMSEVVRRKIGNLYGIPQRLKRFGWKATESNKVTLMESLPDEIEAALKCSATWNTYHSISAFLFGVLFFSLNVFSSIKIGFHFFYGLVTRNYTVARDKRA